MKTSPLVVLLLAAAPLLASAQGSNLEPFMGKAGNLSTPLPSFPDPDWSWTARQQYEEDADRRSLHMHYSFAAASPPLKQGYSAELVTDTTRHVRGNVLRGRETAMYYLAADGRKRYAYKSVNGEERIVIVDPKRQLAYLVRPDREDVLRISGSPQKAVAAAAHVAAQRPARPATQETRPLGSKDFHGMSAAGTLTRTTYQAGALGNDKDMVETRESWTIPALRLTVYSQRMSPRFGETVAQYRNFKLEEPPASVFEPPADYKVRDIPAAEGRKTR